MSIQKEIKVKKFKNELAIILVVLLMFFQTQPKSFSQELESDIVQITNIELSALYGTPGAEISIRGYGFAIEETVILTLGSLHLRNFTTDNLGEFSGKFFVPAIGFEVYKLRAEQPTHGIIVEINFKVGLIALIINPTSGEPGTIITITGIGFTPGGKWEAVFSKSDPSGDLETSFVMLPRDVDDNGNIQFMIEFPFSEAGKYDITIRDIETGISLLITFNVVSPTSFIIIDLSKYSGEYGDTIVVTGSGATAGADVSVYWNVVTSWDGETGLLNSTEAKANGGFEVCFNIPSREGGTNYVWVKDTYTGTCVVSEPFTVTISFPPEPAKFVVSNLMIRPAPPEVEPGEPVYVSVKVSNFGEEYGSYIAALKLDGVFFESKYIALAGGASISIVFITNSMEEGIHKVEVDGLSGYFTVKTTTEPPPTPPKLPHQFYGQVTLEGENAPYGTLVETKIGGITYSSTTTINGMYGYASTFKIPPDDPSTDIKEGGGDGETIAFYVDDSLVSNYVFTSGGVTELDLEKRVTKNYELYLFKGWNLIGLPFIPDDKRIDVVLADILDSVKSVWSYSRFGDALNKIQTLNEGDVCIINIDDSTRKNMESTITCVEALLSRGANIIFFTNNLESITLFSVIMDEVKPGIEYGAEYGEDYVYLGYIAGGETAIAALANDIKGVIAVDYYGTSIDQLPLMKYIGNANDIQLVLSSDSEELYNYYMRQWYIPYGTIISKIVDAEWLSFSPGAPSDLKEMTEGKGYWINMKYDAKLIIHGTSLPGQTTGEITEIETDSGFKEFIYTTDKFRMRFKIPKYIAASTIENKSSSKIEVYLNPTESLSGLFNLAIETGIKVKIPSFSLCLFIDIDLAIPLLDQNRPDLFALEWPILGIQLKATNIESGDLGIHSNAIPTKIFAEDLGNLPIGEWSHIASYDIYAKLESHMVTIWGKQDSVKIGPCE